MPIGGLISNAEAQEASRRGMGQTVSDSGGVIDQVPQQTRVQNRGGLESSSEAIRVLPAEFVKRHQILPLELRNGTLRVATATLGNLRVIDDIRLLTGLEVEELVTAAEEIQQKIAESYRVTVEKMIEELGPGRSPSGDVKDLHDIEVMANEPTVINLVNLVISTALREGASDIHLVPFDDSLQLRYRIDGLLQ